VKSWLKTLAARFGYVVHRWPPTRFDGVDASLTLLRASGFRPTIVIDGGANVGEWTEMARRHFPTAAFHAIEPQPGCRASLDRIAQVPPPVNVHAVAISGPAAAPVFMVGAEGNTGGYVTEAGTPGARPVPSATLDDLFADRITAADRVLLKLDIEGHEVAALSGAERLLPNVEVLLTEFRTFRPYDLSGSATFANLFRFVDARGFDLYDIAALHGRGRDQRLRLGDVIFVRRGTPLVTDNAWE